MHDLFEIKIVFLCVVQTGVELELVDSMALLEWFANNYKSFGATLEIITDKSQEGAQFVKGFGGIGGKCQPLRESIRVPTAQGKQGKCPKKNPCQGKHRELGNLAKSQGIWFAQLVNSLILKVKDILVFAAKFFKFSLKLDSQFCVCNCHNARKLAQGKFAVGQGNNGNLKMQVEWVP